MEIVLLCVCRNLALGLVALSGRQLYQRLAVLLGSFLVLFASSKSGNTAGLFLIGAYAGVGCCWLMLIAWSASSERVSIPVLPAALIVLFICGLIALAASVPHRIASALNGLFPSSGGIRSGSDSSRGGIGDGIDEVSGSKNPKTAGYDNSDIFVNSEKCGLYDAFIENYGEVAKPTEFKKMMMLQQKEIQVAAGQRTMDLRSGRSFSIHRQVPRDENKHQAHDADALLYVTGETPVHLRMMTYDRFDGVEWHASPEGEIHFVLENEGSSNWINVLTTGVPPYLLGERSWRVKTGRLDSDIIPTPAYLTAAS